MFVGTNTKWGTYLPRFIGRSIDGPNTMHIGSYWSIGSSNLEHWFHNSLSQQISEVNTNSLTCNILLSDIF